jgi:integrase/recombinase XerD
MELRNYLSDHYAKTTAAAYSREITLYRTAHPGAGHYRYGQVLDYIGQCRNKYSNPQTINRILASVKVYYDWLCYSGQRKDNPAKSIRLRDQRARDLQLQDLFQPEELERLLDRKERYGDLVIRNQVVLSLLICQGLQLGELTGLRVADVRLAEGTIDVKATAKTNARTLPLKPRQIMGLHSYIGQERPRLLREKTDALILTKLGTAERGEGIHYLVSTCQGLFPDRRLTPQTIRQSVIANLLKQGHDLRVVQTFAGHKYPSTTERYRQSRIEELKAAVQKYHPFG